MGVRIHAVVAALSLLVADPIQAGSAARADPESGIAWQDWSPSVFDEARGSGRRVLVDLTASWCHACNVMEQGTFLDPAVIERIRQGFVPVRVDVDAFPDLHLRFHLEFRGLPTILILDAEGTVLRRANGMNPMDFLDFLEPGIRDDPAPGETSAPPRTSIEELPGAVARELLEDARSTGTPWGGGVFLEAPTLLFLAEMAAAEDSLASRCRRSVFGWLDRLLGPPLLDQEEGGYFRYVPAWELGEPHYEKLLTVQSQVIEAFLTGADAAHSDRRTRYRAAARSTAAFALDHLRAPGSPFFAVALNADVLDPVTGTIVEPGSRYYQRPDRPAGRGSRLEPGVYLDGNARFASALLRLAGLGDTGSGGEGLRLLDALWGSARAPDGTFLHSPGGDEGGQASLHDLASLGIALIDAGSVSQRSDYLVWAMEIARALEGRRRPDGFAFLQELGSAPALLIADGNDRAALFLALLGAATGDMRWLKRAREVLDAVVGEGVLVEADAADLARCALRLAHAKSRSPRSRGSPTSCRRTRTPNRRSWSLRGCPRRCCAQPPAPRGPSSRRSSARPRVHETASGSNGHCNAHGVDAGTNSDPRWVVTSQVKQHSHRSAEVVAVSLRRVAVAHGNLDASLEDKVLEGDLKPRRKEELAAFGARDLDASSLRLRSTLAVQLHERNQRECPGRNLVSQGQIVTEPLSRIDVVMLRYQLSLNVGVGEKHPPAPRERDDRRPGHRVGAQGVGGDREGATSEDCRAERAAHPVHLHETKPREESQVADAGYRGSCRVRGDAAPVHDRSRGEQGQVGPPAVDSSGPERGLVGSLLPLDRAGATVLKAKEHRTFRRRQGHVGLDAGPGASGQSEARQQHAQAQSRGPWPPAGQACLHGAASRLRR